MQAFFNCSKTKGRKKGKDEAMAEKANKDSKSDKNKGKAMETKNERFTETAFLLCGRNKSNGREKEKQKAKGNKSKINKGISNKKPKF